MLHYQSFLYIPKVIYLELISRHHDNPLVGHFGIKKTRELIARKYYWPTLQQDVKAYIKGCNVCLASKPVRHRLYGDLQLLLFPTHRWKDLSINFVTGLPISANWKNNSYNLILVIVNRLTEMVYYVPVKVTINASGLAKVIIDVVVRYHKVPELIVIN